MWIQVVQPEDAEGVLAEIYAEQAARFGRPTELTMLGSLYPALTEIRTKLYHVVESCPSSLSPMERQGVAFVAAAVLGSEYITGGVEGKFLAAGGTSGQAASLRSGDPSVLSPAASALARYARQVAEDPTAVTEDDVEACRQAGATDLDILDANDLAGYYAYLARVCLGLGLRTAPA